jgi:hypothetical protein
LSGFLHSNYDIIMSSLRDSKAYTTLSILLRGRAATSGMTSQGSVPPDVSAYSPSDVHEPLAEWVAEVAVDTQEYDERLDIAYQRCYEKGCPQAHYPC